jgi:hypothetical protein
LIAGLMNNANTSALNDPLGIARFIRSACPGSSMASSLAASGWADMFNEGSDAMVNRTSQLAGMSGLALSGIVHSQGLEQLGFNPPGEIDAQSPVSGAITTLLNAPVRSNSFHSLP